MPFLFFSNSLFTVLYNVHSNFIYTSCPSPSLEPAIYPRLVQEISRTGTGGLLATSLASLFLGQKYIKFYTFNTNVHTITRQSHYSWIIIGLLTVISHSAIGNCEESSTASHTGTRRQNLGMPVCSFPYCHCSVKTDVEPQWRSSQESEVGTSLKVIET